MNKIFHSLNSKLAIKLVVFHSVVVILICLIGVYEKNFPEWLAIIATIILVGLMKVDYLAVTAMESAIVRLIDFEPGLAFVMGFWFVTLGGLQWYFIGWVIEKFFKLINKRHN